MAVCAYCGKARAVNRDHVIPQSLRKRMAKEKAWMKRVRIESGHYYANEIPAYLLVTVPSCFRCNMLKGDSRLVPPSWVDRVDILNELLPGTPWRTWDGSTAALKRVHV